MAVTTAAGTSFADIRVTGFLRKKRGKDMVRAVERGMLEGGRRAIINIQGKTPISTGNLKVSYQLTFRMNPRRVRITSPLTYVGVMERGRRPGRKRPPPGPIRAWVKRKFFVVEEKANKALAFLIGRAIGEKGIKVFRTTGLKHNRGKGAMFFRALQDLGVNFFGRIVRDEISRLR